jgi:hypothetical protein
MSALRNRLDRLDGGDVRNRSVEHLTDAQLDAAILRELRQTNPTLGDRFASATDDEMEAILATIANGGEV